MKTYVITFSTHFPASHPKAGQPTDFVEKIKAGAKLHTIRANYKLWSDRIAEIRHGNAELALRYWSGKPYRSKQVEFSRLGKDAVFVQYLDFGGDIMTPTIDHWIQPDPETLAANDGLSFADWLDWFEGYDLFKPMAVIMLGDWEYSEKNNLP